MRAESYLADATSTAVVAEKRIDEALVQHHVEGAIRKAHFQHVHDSPVHVRTPAPHLPDHHLGVVDADAFAEAVVVQIRAEVGIPAAHNQNPRVPAQDPAQIGPHRAVVPQPIERVVLIGVALVPVCSLAVVRHRRVVLPFLSPPRSRWPSEEFGLSRARLRLEAGAADAPASEARAESAGKRGNGARTLRRRAALLAPKRRLKRYSRPLFVLRSFRKWNS
eukprot:scaffold2660_cov257-Pinguiococcus_pyrenoidosus.AAC.10